MSLELFCQEYLECKAKQSLCLLIGVLGIDWSVVSHDIKYRCQQVTQGKMGAQQYLVALSAVIFCSSLLVGAEAEPKQVDREGKILPVFNIIKFTNDFCTSTSGSRNGTCFTK